ncbi:alpha/beta fold hydrolase [Mesorhizobium escarrei]|uniref:Alpha/beta hydrolase fold family protein n=1 Tax=Mesorhizobium escarrei TaxID=666018 RepID=A0ABM9E5V9_9HYPH|nr:alpha/beta hydrolase [Mesorhizobium escarrei]CAH2404132.1 Alpha/beta hydrolase fold family protein [Mesorhizobium escarrei]
MASGKLATAPRVPPVETVHRSRFISVDGMRTHYLEAGEGPPLVLLHSGEFGGCAELSWEYLIPKLAPHFRVIAPDWLGFGKTAKIHDFDGKRARMLSHMARFVEVMAIDRAHFVGNSMGATFLLQMASGQPCALPIDRLVAISGGGFMPENEERRRLIDYDGTEEAMADLLAAMFEQPVWHLDPDYVRRRHALSNAPGAWEAVAAARFRSPQAPSRAEFGQADHTPYELIVVPTLVIAGDRDRLRFPGFAPELAARIANGEAAVLADCGHCPNIERADAVADLILEFLARDRSARAPEPPKAVASGSPEHRPRLTA